MNARPTPAEILRSNGLPHRRMEDWKYTDVRSVADADSFQVGAHASATISFSNAIEAAGLEGETIPNWASSAIASLAPSSAMDAAARSYVDFSEVFRVPAGKRIDVPLRIEYSGRGHGAAAIFVEANASAEIEVVYSATVKGEINTSLLVFIGEDAHASLTVAAPYARELVLVNTISVAQDRNSQFQAQVVNGGARLSRMEMNVILNGEGAEADLSGVSVLGDEAHADITTRITHASPHTTSRQLFKKVAGGKSRAIYQGKISVKEGAIGSDSRQTAKALLLSDRAEADLKPELEILADDVKCAHGAAVGDLDQESLFYLRSRGIAEDEARSLLIHAFLQEVVDGIDDEKMRASALEFIDKGMAWAMIEAS